MKIAMIGLGRMDMYMLSDPLILDAVRGSLLGALNGKFWQY